MVLYFDHNFLSFEEKRDGTYVRVNFSGISSSFFLMYLIFYDELSLYERQRKFERIF